jgi:competence protein ComEA
VRLSSRSSDDADVIRARLRTLLAETRTSGGWLPDDDDPPGEELDTYGEVPAEGWATVPVPHPSAQDNDPELPQGMGRHRAPGAAVRLDPGKRGAWSLWAAGLVAALVLVGWTWLDRPQVQSVAARSQSGVAVGRSSAPASPAVGEVGRTSATVVVSVVGRVVHPGLVTVPTGARVADAVAAAGGLLPGVDASAVNLAAVVSDGQQIAVGVPGAVGAGTSVGRSTGGAAGGPVNLNTATVADLDALPGIGPVLAQRIIDYRDQQGPFTSVQQLDDVPGIGPAIFAELAKLVGV